jgi:hypothetical protein
MQPIDIVLSLMDPSADHCTAIENAWVNDVESFWIGLSLSTSPDYNFGLNRVPALDEADDEPGTLTFDEFYDLAMRLAHGDLVGVAAHEAVESAALRADAKEWNFWYRRILLKSLTKHLPMDTIQKELIRLTTE